MNSLWIIIPITFIAAFYLGYRFCKFRWGVKDMLKGLEVQSQFITGEITAEKAVEEFDKLLDD